MANYSRKSNNKTNRNAYFAQKAEREAKKLPTVAKFAMVLLFLIGVVASFFVCKFICKNDCFEINGKKSYSLVVGQTYIDEGVTVIGFGQNLKDKVTIEVYKDSTKIDGLDSIDTSQEATYQIVYKVSSFRFKDVQLIRTVTVVSDQAEDYETEEDSYTPTAFKLQVSY